MCWSWWTRCSCARPAHIDLSASDMMYDCGAAEQQTEPRHVYKPQCCCLFTAEARPRLYRSLLILADIVTPPYLNSGTDGHFISASFSFAVAFSKNWFTFNLRHPWRPPPSSHLTFSLHFFCFDLKSPQQIGHRTWCVRGKTKCKFKSDWAHVVIQKMSFILMLMSQHTNHILFNKRKVQSVPGI